VSTQDQIVDQMRAALAQSDVDLDTSIGTTTRKILDVVGQAISEAYVDEHVSSYQYDIDSKIGADLDSFVQLFGIARIAARRASGSLTFSRPVGDNSYIPIPVNTLVGTLDPSQVNVITIAGGVIAPGQTSVSVPCQAVLGGTTGNIGAGLMTQLLTNIQGVRVTNSQALTGGTDGEDDESLRIRWKKTVFRSMVGTEDMYLGIALDDDDAYAANVLGAAKTHTEQIAVVSGAATSENNTSTYNYEDTVIVGNNIDAGDVFLLNYDFTVVPGSNPLQIQKTGGTVSRMQDGIYDLSYKYTPAASRNIPNKHINNRVDVWVAGTRSRDAVQSLRWDPARVFSATSTSDYYNQLYIRLDSSHPTVGNIFIPLHFGPILSVPSTLTISGITYNKNVDYWIVHRNDAFGYTPVSLFGLEWRAASAPANNPVFTVGSGYAYNEVPSTIQMRIEDSRLIGTDVKVHQAKSMYLRFNLVVMYTPTASISSVKALISQRIQAKLNSTVFGAVLQASDILAIVAGVPGVDNVRFRDGQDISGYNSSMLSTSTPPSIAIQQVVPFQNTVTLGAPTLTTHTGSGTGGTIPAGTYFYVVTAVNADGETAASNELSNTLSGTTSKVTLGWSTVADATSYNIYRSTTTGTEVYLDTVYGSGTTSYIDLGSATPGVTTPPTTSTASAPGNVQVIQTFCVPSTGRAVDIEFTDDQVGVFDPNNGLYLDRRAQNNFYNTSSGGL
jgi:uncharacterized phage protein gp47/JayE